ncbi:MULTISPECIES: permease [unclassified Streptomyces]|uniref:permease n=1 Tax=unclassified Streptomyces TaxID=2593676 RepID=UPI002365F152|nr:MULTISPECIES: permease [unclassified Streptomyces]MDF3139969.1 permease [Streptomyces sp. T21Q-yed]WDF39891.1 permease [Streptomyces sp. T12]
MLETVLDVLRRTALDVWGSFTDNWPYLLISVVVASAIPVYVGADRLSSWLRRRTWLAIGGAILLATLTPFCSCGTTAVVLGALASSVPWAPVVAFMVSSPLTSPEEYVYSTGLFGFSFATTFFVAAIVIGVFAGALTWLIEKTGWLANQARMTSGEVSCCGTVEETKPKDQADEGGCCGSTSDEGPAGGGGSVPLPTPGLARTALLTRPAPTKPTTPAPVEVSWVKRYKLAEFASELKTTSRRLALYFFGFAAIGWLIIEAIPTSTLTSLLGGDSLLAVPVSALLGIPIYLNSEGSLPLVAALMHGGLGPGPALAFLITGAGTSIGAISGMLLIARIRVVALVVGILLTGAIATGYLAPLWL